MLAPRRALTLAMFAIAACGGDATSPATGRLAILFDALAANDQASVTVSGPNGFTRTVTSADTLDGLARGKYTVTASDVTTSGSRYRATPPIQTVDVPATGMAAATSISYRLASARLTLTLLGLPAGSAGSVNVTGPNGFSRNLVSSSTLELLEPGSTPLRQPTCRPSPRHTIRRLQAR